MLSVVCGVLFVQLRLFGRFLGPWIDTICKTRSDTIFKTCPITRGPVISLQFSALIVTFWDEIMRVLWPPRSPDLISSEFHLYGIKSYHWRRCEIKHWWCSVFKFVSRISMYIKQCLVPCMKPLEHLLEIMATENCSAFKYNFPAPSSCTGSGNLTN